MSLLSKCVTAPMSNMQGIKTFNRLSALWQSNLTASLVLFILAAISACGVFFFNPKSPMLYLIISANR